MGGAPAHPIGPGAAACFEEHRIIMAKVKIRNIFANFPAAAKKEAFSVLAKGRNFKIERIVSCGQATPKNKWLCQKQAEWAIVLKGRARLLFKHDKRKISLKAGDYLFIPANTPHRIDWTSRKQKTIWLAIHLAGL